MQANYETPAGSTNGSRRSTNRVVCPSPSGTGPVQGEGGAGQPPILPTTLSRTEIKASVDGVVSSRMVEPYEVAEPGRPLMTIVDVGDLEVDFMVSRRDIRSPSQVQLWRSSNP